MTLVFILSSISIPQPISWTSPSQPFQFCQGIQKYNSYLFKLIMLGGWVWFLALDLGDGWWGCFIFVFFTLSFQFN